MAPGSEPPLFVLVTDTRINASQTGIQTLVRSLIGGLVQLNHPFRLVEWRPPNQALFRLRPAINAQLGKPGERKFVPVKLLLRPENWPFALEAKARNYRLPIHRHPEHRDRSDRGWLLIPELVYLGDAARITDYARRVGLRVAAIFHDAIPVSHPHVVRPDAVNSHADYMRALTRADVILAVSRQSADAFTQFADTNGLPLQQVNVCYEPAEILGVRRVTEPQPGDSSVINALCVSTLEPRKNHLVLIQAFEDFLTAFPDVNAVLHLVGASYGAAPEIAKAVTETASRNARIRWHGQLSQLQLVDRYRVTDFTIYPSFLEGFGLPVVESLWLGKPCICANFGAVAESAAGGGCLMVNVRDRRLLSDAIASMATRPELRQSLAREAMARPLKTWRDYAGEIRDALTAPEQRTGGR